MVYFYKCRCLPPNLHNPTQDYLRTPLQNFAQKRGKACAPCQARLNSSSILIWTRPSTQPARKVMIAREHIFEVGQGKPKITQRDALGHAPQNILIHDSPQQQSMEIVVLWGRSLTPQSWLSQFHWRPLFAKLISFNICFLNKS